ncbi:MAG: hypothetical protein ACRDYV_18075 [Acidimicrobiia bacterium]
MILAHGGHFFVYAFPVVGILVLWLTLRGDAAQRRQQQRESRGEGASVPKLPRTELSRQVWKAKKAPRAARRAAAPKPKFEPKMPTPKVAPFQPPRERDRREA